MAGTRSASVTRLQRIKDLEKLGKFPTKKSSLTEQSARVIKDRKQQAEELAELLPKKRRR